MSEKGELEGAGSAKTEIWSVTRETAEIEAEHKREEAARRKLEAGLAKCPICGMRAKVVEFGLEGNGVWIGCDRTEECSRYIEIHTEGWSVWEVAEEWNRYNRGVFLVIRRAKRWIRKHFGAEKWRNSRENREFLEKKRAEEAKRREILGIKEPERGGFWHKVLARWQKVSGNTSVEIKSKEN
jgi:ssDNA-binding Zn-finger/Zn-ribbon topoisomerase 1